MKQFLVIAFPGCGKTTTVKAIRDEGVETAVDFDLKGSKKLLTGVVKMRQTDLVEAFFNSGADFVFTHNGAVNVEAILSWVPSVTVVFVVPKYDMYHYWLGRISKRDGECRFLEAMKVNYRKWLDDYHDLYLSLLRRHWPADRVRLVHLDYDEYITRELFDRL